MQRFEKEIHPMLNFMAHWSKIQEDEKESLRKILIEHLSMCQPCMKLAKYYIEIMLFGEKVYLGPDLKPLVDGAMEALSDECRIFVFEEWKAKSLRVGLLREVAARLKKNIIYTHTGRCPQMA